MSAAVLPYKPPTIPKDQSKVSKRQDKDSETSKKASKNIWNALEQGDPDNVKTEEAGFASNAEGEEPTDNEQEDEAKRAKLAKKGSEAATKFSQELPLNIYQRHAEFYKRVRETWWENGVPKEDEKEIEAFNERVIHNAKEKNKNGTEKEIRAAHLQFPLKTVKEFVNFAAEHIRKIGDENLDKKFKQDICKKLAGEMVSLRLKGQQNNSPTNLIYPESVFLTLSQAVVEAGKFDETMPYTYEPSSMQLTTLTNGFRLLDEMVEAASQKQVQQVKQLSSKYDAWTEQMQEVNSMSLVRKDAYMPSEQALALIREASEKDSNKKAKSLMKADRSKELASLRTLAELVGFKDWNSSLIKQIPRLPEPEVGKLRETLAASRALDGSLTDAASMGLRSPRLLEGNPSRSIADKDDKGLEELDRQEDMFVPENSDSGIVRSSRTAGSASPVNQLANTEAYEAEVEEESDYSDTDIGPPQIEGNWTSRGLIEGMRRFGFIGFRVIMNVGLEERPFYTVVMGSQMGRKQLARHWEDFKMPEPGVNPRDRSEEHIKRATHMCESHESLYADRRPPTYFLIEYHKDKRNPYYRKAPCEEWLTRSQLITIQGQRLTRYMEAKCRERYMKNWDTFQSRLERGEHPVTKKPLTKQFRKQHPWLFEEYLEIDDTPDPRPYKNSNTKRTKNGYYKDGFVESGSDNDSEVNDDNDDDSDEEHNATIKRKPVQTKPKNKGKRAMKAIEKAFPAEEIDSDEFRSDNNNRNDKNTSSPKKKLVKRAVKPKRSNQAEESEDEDLTDVDASKKSNVKKAKSQGNLFGKFKSGRWSKRSKLETLEPDYRDTPWEEKKRAQIKWGKGRASPSAE